MLDWICTFCADKSDAGVLLCMTHKEVNQEIIQMTSTGKEKQWVRAITRFSINRLYPHVRKGGQHRWLDDEVINGFFQLARSLDVEICLESKTQPSFFGNMLICQNLNDLNLCEEGNDFADIARKYIYSALCDNNKTRWSNIYQMPAHRYFFAFNMANNHYVRLTFYPDKNLIILYNPFLTEAGWALAVKLQIWLAIELRKHEETGKKISPCRIECRKTAFPRQRNNDDCGVFILASLLCEITNTPEIFSQTDIIKLRHLMVSSFVEKKIDVSHLKFIYLFSTYGVMV
jgi:hypothetical protein